MITRPNGVTTGVSDDANGNLLSDGTTTYTYDAANRLTQTVKDGITTTYAYDGWGTRMGYGV